MGTTPNPAAHPTTITNPDPADQYADDVIGIVAELRVISYLLVEGLNLDVDLDAIRNQFTPIKS